MYQCFASTHIGASHACMLDACGDQKRVSDSLELELQMVVSCLSRSWESNLSLMKEHPVLLTTEPHFQLCIFSF